MRAAKLVGLVCITGLLSAGAVAAKDKNGKGAQEKGESENNRSVGQVKVTFSDHERGVIRTYVEGYEVRGRGKKAKGLPPGLAKKVARGEELPPGWQKKCVAGEIMPEEVYEKCHPLPPELVIKLPAPPVGTITVSVAGQVVRLIKATREILDVFNVHSR